MRNGWIETFVTIVCVTALTGCGEDAAPSAAPTVVTPVPTATPIPTSTAQIHEPAETPIATPTPEGGRGR